MKITRRICCGLLAVLLALGMAACTPAEEADGTPTPGETGEGAPPVETTPSPEQGIGYTVALVETEDVVQRLLGFPRDTALLKVNDVPVKAEDYLYCLSYATENLCLAVFESMDQVDWELTVDGLPLQLYILQDALETTMYYSVVRAKAEEYGVTISAAEQAELDLYITDVITGLGGEEEYALWLQMWGMSDEGFRAMTEVGTLYDGLTQTLFGDQDPAQEELAAFVEETANALMAKHILIKTVDDNNQPLSEEETASARTLAEDLLAQLRASDDPLTLFDRLMNEYSEDTRLADGTLAAPDGYLFVPGYMVEAFEKGTRALEYYEISGLVESEYGYHIILRLPPVNDTARSAWISAMMSDQMDLWFQYSQLELTDDFSTITPKNYYELLAAYREELQSSGAQ